MVRNSHQLKTKMVEPKAEPTYPSMEPEIVKVRSNTKISLTIREKQFIIQKHDKLPAFMSQAKKAACLGLNRMTLRNILARRDR